MVTVLLVVAAVALLIAAVLQEIDALTGLAGDHEIQRDEEADR